MSHAAQAVAPKDPTDPAPVDAITQNEITPALPVTQNDAGEENPVGGSKKKGLGQIARELVFGGAGLLTSFLNRTNGPCRSSCVDGRRPVRGHPFTRLGAGAGAVTVACMRQE